MDFDICIIGGGIVGLATALAAFDHDSTLRIVLVEKETAVARHQTGHNSGVIHSGIYYEPGSLKARLCREGCEAIKLFAQQHSIPFQECGKLIVATNKAELKRMSALYERAISNSIEVDWIEQAELERIEPNIRGLAALRIKTTGIIDYAEVCRVMASELQRRGATILFGEEVNSIKTTSTGVSISTTAQNITAGHLIACAGMQSDRIARLAGLKLKVRIIPFRGEYFLLPEKHNDIVNHLIYPVPDPDLPFLGIHLTRMMSGRVTVGPNAVLGFDREGYSGRIPIKVKDSLDILSYGGFWRLLAKEWRTATDELKDSIFKKGYLEKCRKFCPSLELEDLMEYPAGIRAQVVRDDGVAEQDFVFVEAPHMTHVLNAPSPAATAAIPIGCMIIERASAQL